MVFVLLALSLILKSYGLLSSWIVTMFIFLANITCYFLYLVATFSIDEVFSPLQKVFISGVVEMVARALVSQINLVVQFTGSIHLLIMLMIAGLILGQRHKLTDVRT